MPASKKKAKASVCIYDLAPGELRCRKIVAKNDNKFDVLEIDQIGHELIFSDVKLNTSKMPMRGDVEAGSTGR